MDSYVFLNNHTDSTYEYRPSNSLSRILKLVLKV
jgi:hypothetical protein